MNKKLLKVVVLILSCLILIGAAVAVTAAAEGTPAQTTVKIAKKNLAYEGAIQVVYLVEAENLPEGAEVGILFGEKFKKSAEIYELGGEEYFAVFSDGIVADEYRKNLVAVPAIRVDGEVTVTGESLNFTPYDYAIQRFNGNYTTGQFNLYKALLDYGAAVQAVVSTPDEIAATGWIDEYYRLTLNGEAAYKRGVDFNGKVCTDRFDKEGKIFDRWTDGEGKTVVGFTSVNIKPGDTVLNTVYKVADASLETFTEGSGDVKTTAKHASNKGDAPQGGYYDLTNGYFVFEQVNHKGNGDKVKLAPSNPGVYAKRYVFEADFNLYEMKMEGNDWVHKFCIWGAEDKWEIFNAVCSKVSKDTYKIGSVVIDFNSWNHIKMVAEVLDNGSVTTRVYVNNALAASGGASDSLSKYNDYKMMSGGLGMRSNSGIDCGDAIMYLDNMMCYTEGEAVSYGITLNTNGGDTMDPYVVTMGQAYELPVPTNGEIPFLGWYKGNTLIPQTGTWTHYGAAPTLTAKWATAYTATLDPNGGQISSTTATVYGGSGYELPVPTRTGLIFGGWVDENGKEYEAKAITSDISGDISLTAKWIVSVSEKGNDFSSNSGGVTMDPGSVTLDNGKVTVDPSEWGMLRILPEANVTNAIKGQIYSLEFVFTYNGITASTLTYASSGDKCLGWIGFQTINGLGNANMIHSYRITDGGDSDKDGIIDYVNMFGQKYYVGEEVTVRLDYTVGSGKTAKVYHDGVFMGYAELNGGVNNVAKVGETVQSFGAYFRYDDCIGDFSFDLDSYKFSVLSESVRTTATLDPSYGTIPEEEKTVSYMTGEEYVLPVPVHDTLDFLNWTYNGSPVPTTGRWMFNSDVTLEAKFCIKSEVSSDFSSGSKPSFITGNGTAVVNSNGKLDVAYSGTALRFLPKSSVADAATGSRYIVEFEFTYNGGDFGATNDANKIAFVGFNPKGDWETYSMAHSTINMVENGEKVTMFGYTFEKGKSYTVRYEYTVGGGVDGTIAYVNGARIENCGAARGGSYSTGMDTSFEFFSIQLRGKAANRNISLSFDNVKVITEIEVGDCEVTLDSGYGTLPADEENVKIITTGTRYTLPTPTLEGYLFLGWYNGSQRVADSGIWKYKNSVTLEAKYDQIIGKSPNIADKSGSIDDKFNAGSDGASKDPSGTRYVFKTTFTYKGISAFYNDTGDGTSAESLLKPFTDLLPNYIRIYGPNSSGSSTISYGPTSTVGGNLVNADGDIVAKNGLLLPDYLNEDGTAAITTAEIFFSQFKWYGLTFEIGEVYQLEMAITMTNGGKPTVVMTAIDSLGEIKTSSFTATNAINVVSHFRWELRSAGNASGSKISKFSSNMSFIGTSFNKTLPTVENTVTLDVGEGATLEGATSFTGYNGMKITLPTAYREGYIFSGWTDGEFLYNGSFSIRATETLTACFVTKTLENDKYADKVDLTVIGTKDLKSIGWAFNTNPSEVTDLPGTKYIFSMTYSYKGLSSFTIDAETKKVTPIKSNQDYGFARFSTVNFSDKNDDIICGSSIKGAGSYVDKNGNTVVTNGVLTDDSITADQIYFAQLTWCGLSFTLNKVYNITFEITMMGVGKAPVIVVTATNVDDPNDVQTKKLVPEDTNYASTTCTCIGSFMLQQRSKDYCGAYTLTQNIVDVKYELYTPVAEEQ